MVSPIRNVPTPDASPVERALSISQLTAQIKNLLESGIPSVWVAGEVSNFSRPQSGHCYFTLKDEHAQIRGVVWQSAYRRLKLALADGQSVICHGRLEVYPQRGTYQLVVDHVQLQGIGALEVALQKLREKLAAEGLFDAGRKRRLPQFPRRLAIVTSPTGAAIRDFLEVLRRRWRGVEVLVIPSRVQGEGAAREVVAGIRAANRLLPVPDVLVVARGGGSLEDLWTFNEEAVVRAITSSKIPIVSAVGHEIDVTLSDLAADVRALTPSEAAERVVPAADDVAALMHGHRQRLSHAVARYLLKSRGKLDALSATRSLRKPFDVLHDRSRRLDELAARTGSAVRAILRDGQGQLATLAGKLDSLSPLGVLERGYSLTRDEKTGQLIKNSATLVPGQRIVTRFASGEATSDVVKTFDIE
jgi:exodeoxyribonuclease VII large subunit